MKPLRCAVYTRKSTEDGLEQEFNSLDAQREACDAYILSQRHEGWSLVPNHYDDGGFSGGNIERPGLKALLADIDAGLVDVIVVYKVDRLTRSLADFAKIVERLDAKQASFVSVTQAFNTTTSMGRLTLNVLLSFAQFEREVTGERIRDKIAASKKKGLWMGGPVPLGYQVVERKLVPVPEEAERVREIMRRFIASTSANQLIAELEAEGIRTKVQQRTSGPHRGGIPFKRGSLFHLLSNPIYRGKIVHKGKVYDGEHEAIVDEALWDAVQARLEQKAPPRKRKSNDPQEAMLRGLLIDPEGRPMVPTYTKKGTRRYAYYETRKDLAAKPDATPPTRIAQSSIERHIVTHLTTLLDDEHALRRLTDLEEASQLTALFEAARLRRLELQHPATRDETVRALIASIAFGTSNLRLSINLVALGSIGEAPLELSLPEPKPFREAKLRIDTTAATDQIDRKLVGLIAEAMEVRELVLASPELSLNQLGKREGRCRTQLGKLFRLSWLSPRIVEAIIDGRQPARLDRRTLLEADLPLCWRAQEQMLGFAA
ncbi:recombinase family protein [Erythrobacter sp. sf7]|uniref:Recombinase family protein n=1 Tax=Erythrobacter fulvus TaxID=2987523 RepID=A0ABT5JPS5_9SPHN|nr:recombinase family protein [Erythrobacter fulvus]MDC8754772.1 recombinase family protein [Erythrobacter fulvus]